MVFAQIASSVVMSPLFSNTRRIYMLSRYFLSEDAYGFVIRCLLMFGCCMSCLRNGNSSSCPLGKIAMLSESCTTKNTTFSETACISRECSKSIIERVLCPKWTILGYVNLDPEYGFFLFYRHIFAARYKKPSARVYSTAGGYFDIKLSWHWRVIDQKYSSERKSQKMQHSDILQQQNKITGWKPAGILKIDG